MSKSASSSCPESTLDSAVQLRNRASRILDPLEKKKGLQGSPSGSIKCEYSPESGNRRNFIKKAVLATAAAGVGSTLLAKPLSLIPESSAASSSNVTLTTDTDKRARDSSASSNGQVVGSSCCPATFGVQGLEGGHCGIGVWGYVGGCNAVGVRGCHPGCAKGYGVIGSTFRGTGVFGFADGGTGVSGSSYCGVGVKGVASSEGVIPLVAQGNSCGHQTENLQQWQLGCCFILDVVNKCGWFGIGTPNPTSPLEVQGTILSSAPVATSTPIIAQGASGQSAYLQQWENSCGKVLSAVNKDGWLGIGSICDSKIRPLSPICVTGTIAACGGFSNIAIFGHNVGCSTVGTPAVSGASCNGVGVEGVACCVGAVPIVARARVSEQVANLQQWEKACTTLSVVNKCGWLGLGTSIPTTTLNVNGSVAAKIVSATSNYKMGASDFAVLASGAITVTLPKASTAAGMIVFIKNTSTSKVTVKGFTNTKETDTIEGASTKLLKKQYDSLQLISNGTNEWFVLGNSICAAFTS